MEKFLIHCLQILGNLLIDEKNTEFSSKFLNCRQGMIVLVQLLDLEVSCYDYAAQEASPVFMILSWFLVVLTGEIDFDAGEEIASRALTLLG